MFQRQLVPARVLIRAIKAISAPTTGLIWKTLELCLYAGMEALLQGSKVLLQRTLLAVMSIKKALFLPPILEEAERESQRPIIIESDAEPLAAVRR